MSTEPDTDIAAGSGRRGALRKAMHLNLTGQGPDASPQLSDFSPLIRKLGGLMQLSADEISFLEGLQINRAIVESRTDFVREGEDFEATYVLQRGWAIRYRTLEDGRRQIHGFLLPGDVVGLNVNFRRRATYSVAAHTECELALVEPMRLMEIQQRFPILSSALSWITVREYAILAEHAVRLGRRSAYERTVHLLLELYQRLELIGAADDLRFTFPVSQNDLSDVLGLSLVHVNRTIRRLNREQVVRIDRRHVELLDVDRLREIADMPEAFLEDFAVL